MQQNTPVILSLQERTRKKECVLSCMKLEYFYIKSEILSREAAHDKIPLSLDTCSKSQLTEICPLADLGLSFKTLL